MRSLGTLRIHERDAQLREVSLTPTPAHASTAIDSLIRRSNLDDITGLFRLTQIARSGAQAQAGIDTTRPKW
jgi:hypothetical protein